MVRPESLQALNTVRSSSEACVTAQMFLVCILMLCTAPVCTRTLVVTGIFAAVCILSTWRYRVHSIRRNIAYDAVYNALDGRARDAVK